MPKWVAAPTITLGRPGGTSVAIARVARRPYCHAPLTPSRCTLKRIDGAALRRLAAMVASRVRRCDRLLVVLAIAEE
jgi:hypothetical protein